MTHLAPIQTAEQMKAIHNGLVEEGGMLLTPTHSIFSEGELIGAVSIGVTPTLHFWFRRDNGQALKSVRAIRQAEKILKDAGIYDYQTIVPDASPFARHADRLGFVRPFADKSTLYIRNIGGQ